MIRTITILNTQRAKNSKMGNPCFYVTFHEVRENKSYFGTAITGTDCAIGYEIENYIGNILIVKFSNREKLNLPVITGILALGESGYDSI